MKNKLYQTTPKCILALGCIMVVTSIILAACGTANKSASQDHGNKTVQTEPSHSTYTQTNSNDLIDFGSSNFKKLSKKFQSLANNNTQKNSTINIIQLGDSHTASDTLTGILRKQLQQQFGDAGIGWITPMNVSGQRHGLVNFQSSKWQLTSSRTSKNADFPMGGYLATPTEAGAQINLTPRQPSNERWQVKLIVKSPSQSPLTLSDSGNQSITLSPKKASNAWQEVEAEVSLPLTITANAAYQTQLGGIWLTKKNASGVTMSPIGTNGIQQTNWRLWSDQWTEQLANSNADLVILAYGTNEAFNSNLDVTDMENALRLGIRMVKNSLPDATILIIGAPDSMRSKASRDLTCEQRQPAMLQQVKQAQLRVAQQEKTLYWDWQKAMGGDCSILQWQQEGLAARDLVHFSNSGYQKSAEILYNDLMSLAGIKKKSY